MDEPVHGKIRASLELMKAVAKFSGLTIEQVADFYDAVAKQQADAESPTPICSLYAKAPEGPQ